MNDDGPKGDLYTRWLKEFSSIEARDKLVDDMIKAGMFPNDERIREEDDRIEREAGLFPDITDPLFTEKLFHKREFAELKQRSMSEMLTEAEEEEKRIDARKARGEPIDQDVKEFEISPVQRFVSRFMSPSTPYNSALLYHGVGVGKTCAAITTAEVFLQKYPDRRVIILAPPNIQPNFRREIFDINKVKWGDGKTIPNRALGCTGSTYLQLANCLMMKETEASLVKYRIERMIDKRYMIFGYLEFANYIEGIFTKQIARFIKGRARTMKENALLRDFFSGRLIIVDEAHNLRESFEAAPKKPEKKVEKAKEGEETKEGDEIALPDARTLADDADADASPEDKKVHEEGKRSASRLMEVLDKAEGTKLLLLTATPMYNDPGDLIFLLNLLLLNDKLARLSMLPPGVRGSLFNQEDIKDGRMGIMDVPVTIEGSLLTKEKLLSKEGEKLIGNAASAYISFMRGENPLNFPVRLKPYNAPSYDGWTPNDVNGVLLTSEDEKARMTKLPFIPCTLRGLALRTNVTAIQSAKKVTANYNSEIFFAQSANIVFPVKTTNILEMIGNKGFTSVFSLADAKAGNASLQYITDVNPSWMSAETIGEYSPKMDFIINRLRTSKGVAFIYSRFIAAGGLALAIALEVNGYMAAGARSRNILKGHDFVGQCALCDQKSNAHTNTDHTFTQAHYVFLSGDTGLSGNNRDSIDRATISSGPESNVNGQRIKVIIGSTVAGEGIDLKFIREIYVLDTWFHLNKLEQILGRGIRNKSHIALPKEKRNVTVYLLTNQFPKDSTFGDRETSDMFFYRYALNKAYKMGTINRFIKQHALDCNLNYEAVVILGIQQRRYQIDSQGNELNDQVRNGIRYEKVDLNDQPFTSICDWQEDCKITCAAPLQLSNDPSESDTLTYDDYGSKYRNSQLRERLRRIFLEQSYYTYNDLRKLFNDIPEIALVNLLSEIVNNRNFLFGTQTHQGYITFRNDYYLFQPIRIPDLRIPMAIRAAEYPVKRDSYEFEKLAAPKVEAGLTTVSQVDVAKLTQLWSLLTKWCLELGVPNKNGAMPAGLEPLIRKRYEYSSDKLRRVTEELSMITYLYNNIKMNADLLFTYKDVVMYFLWDEYLTNDEQFTLFKQLRGDSAAEAIMDPVWAEQKVTLGTDVGFRLVQRFSAKFEYYSYRSTSNTFELELSDRMIQGFDRENRKTSGLRANSTTCGYVYGTLNVKRGEFVFKTNTPVVPNDEDPAAEDKGKKGRECAGSSASKYHKDKLYEIGAKAAEDTALRTDMGLNAGVIERGPRAIPKTNSNMICALTDLALRVLDAKAVDRKRWFFRPVATLKTGHPSIVALKIE